MNTRQYFQDKTIFTLFVLSVAISVIGILAIIFRVHSADVLVPVRYLSTTDVQRANWINLYQFGLFYALACVIHIILSMRLFSIKRGYAYAVLAGYLFLAVIGLRVTGAVISLFY